MDNITKNITRIIDNDPILRKGLNMNIINKRALALYIMKTYKMEYPINGIISAIRRYETNIEKDILKDALEVIKNSTMTSKNGISSITLVKDEISERSLPKLFSVIEVDKHQQLRLIQADESIKIIIDKKNLEKVKKILPEKNILKIDENIAEITIHLDKKAWHTPGITSIITTELSLNNINIVEIMSCIPEIIIFFKEKDLMSAYSVLYKIYGEER